MLGLLLNLLEVMVYINKLFDNIYVQVLNYKRNWKIFFFMFFNEIYEYVIL